MSKALDDAMTLLGEEPLPADAFERLTALEAQADPGEAEYFGDLWEAFYAAGGEDPVDELAAEG
jgi:hypothetical protein